LEKGIRRFLKKWPSYLIWNYLS